MQMSGKNCGRNKKLKVIAVKLTLCWSLNISFVILYMKKLIPETSRLLPNDSFAS